MIRLRMDGSGMQYNYRAQTGFALITCSVEAVLCTVGPAGLQASCVRCSVHEQTIYAHVPSSSDQMANLEQAAEVILTTPIWQLRGVGTMVPHDGLQTMHFPPALLHDVERLGLTLVQITPHRMHINIVETSNQRETIDFVSDKRFFGL